MKHRSRLARYHEKNPTTETYVLAGVGALVLAGVAYLLLRQSSPSTSPGVVTLGPGGSSSPVGSATSSSATPASTTTAPDGYTAMGTPVFATGGMDANGTTTFTDGAGTYYQQNAAGAFIPYTPYMGA